MAVSECEGGSEHEGGVRVRARRRSSESEWVATQTV